MTRTILQISGMHCNSCEELIRDILSDLSIKTISANHKTGKVEIDFDARISLETIKQAIETEGDGYRVK